MADTSNKDPPDLELDLGSGAIRYLRLLTKIHLRRKQTGHHGNQDPILSAIYRYETYWLPLVAESGSKNLKPSWDVYYVWCLHILTSLDYRRYCQDRFGKIVDHQFEESVKEEDEARERGKALWEEHFPEERFEASSGSGSSQKDSGLSEVIFQSEEKQATFFYQVSLSHFRDRKFVDSAVYRYRKLLGLKAVHPTADLCPTADIEVVRHAHVLHPAAYEADLGRILGEVVEFGVLEKAFDKVKSYDQEERMALETTRRLWSVMYKTDYDIAGVRHRGIPETDLFTEATQNHLRQSEPDSMMMFLDEIKIADLWSKDQKIIVEGRRLGKTSYTYESLFRVSGKSGVSLSTGSNPSRNKFNFSLRDNRGIELHTYGTKGRFCFKKENHVATTFFDPRKLYEEGQKLEDIELTVEIPRISYGDPTVSFVCGVNVVHRAKPHVFTLYREAFASGPIPHHLKPFIRLGSWSDVDTFDMDIFYSARHSVRTPLTGGTNFTVEVVSCRDLDLGAVLVYEQGSDPVVVAHTIGDDQLPLPEQVSPDFSLSLDRLSGQHAMLIRNQNGDWGTVVVKPLPGTDGSMSVICENLQKHVTMETTFTYDQSAILKLGAMTVDLHTGRVTLTPDCADAAEHVALAYVLGVLYVFVIGHQLPEVTRQMSSDGDDVTKPSVGGRTTSSLLRPKPSKRYDVSSRSLSARFSSAVTLSNLKSRRKKRSPAPTMLLACGLQANMMVEEDLSRMSFHSEVSLLSRDTDEDDKPDLGRPRGMDEIHRQTFYKEVRDNARELNENRHSMGNFRSPTSGYDQFTFRRPGQEQVHHEQTGEGKPRKSVVLHDVDENRNIRKMTPRESWPDPNAESFYDTADLYSTVMPQSKSRARDNKGYESDHSDDPPAIPERHDLQNIPNDLHNATDDPYDPPLPYDDPSYDTVDFAPVAAQLEMRAQHIVDHVMAGALNVVRNSSGSEVSVGNLPEQHLVLENSEGSDGEPEVQDTRF